MVLYLTLFLIFIAIYKWAETDERWWAILIAVLIPTLFEGLRDEFVGEDMLGYGSEWFYMMDQHASIFSMIEDAQTPEYGYHLLIYICKNLYPDIHLYMTACALIKMTAVTLFAYKMRCYSSSVLFLFCYYCFFYVTSFSMMRQGIAVAICIYSLYYFFNKDVIRFFITILIAYFFHNSAILMLLILPIYYLRNLKYKYYIILGGIVIVYLSVAFLFELVLMTPLFKSEMADLYIDSGVPTAKTNILISVIFLGYAVYCYFLEDEEENEETYMLLITSSVTLLFLSLSSYIEVAFRMSYYMFIMSLVIMARYIYESEYYRITKSVALGLLFLLHFYISCTHGLVGALDYTSKIMGIY